MACSHVGPQTSKIDDSLSWKVPLHTVEGHADFLVGNWREPLDWNGAGRVEDDNINNKYDNVYLNMIQISANSIFISDVQCKK